MERTLIKDLANNDKCCFCNYCKYFSVDHIDRASGSWFILNDCGPGHCLCVHSSKRNDITYFYNFCDQFLYSPIVNRYNLDSPDYIEMWTNARKFQGLMYQAIMDYKIACMKKERAEKQSHTSVKDIFPRNEIERAATIGARSLKKNI